MHIFKNAQAYDWQTWLLGIMRSIFSGGAAALISLGGATAAGLNISQVAKLTGTSFVLMALYRLGEFLQLHGAPDKLQQALNTADSANQQAGAAIQEAKASSDTTAK